MPRTHRSPTPACTARCGGSLVVRGIEGHERWAAAGHNAAYTFDGTDYLVLHAYDRSDRGRSKLIIEPIQWDEEGWPFVRLDPE